MSTLLATDKSMLAVRASTSSPQRSNVIVHGNPLTPVTTFNIPATSHTLPRATSPSTSAKPTKHQTLQKTKKKSKTIQNIETTPALHRAATAPTFRSISCSSVIIDENDPLGHMNNNNMLIQSQRHHSRFKDKIRRSFRIFSSAKKTPVKQRKTKYNNNGDLTNYTPILLNDNNYEANGIRPTALGVNMVCSSLARTLTEQSFDMSGYNTNQNSGSSSNTSPLNAAAAAAADNNDLASQVLAAQPPISSHQHTASNVSRITHPDNNNDASSLLPAPVNNHFQATNKDATKPSHQQRTDIDTSGHLHAGSMIVNGGCVSGYLQKWTNYLKGYQKRWFVLNNGLLSYFRNQAEMAHTCRGTINLSNAQIASEDSCHFVVTNGASQTFHLKAANEAEKQRWVSALEIAKGRARQFGVPSTGAGANSTMQPDSDDDDSGLEQDKKELANMLRFLQQKLDELSKSHEFVVKHSNLLNKSLVDLEGIQTKPDENMLKTLNERSTVYKITMQAVVSSCQEFINLAQLQTRKMHKVLQSEREMRTKLEDMVQEMAKQHLSFETQLSKRTGMKRNILVKTNRDGTLTRADSSLPSDAEPSNKSNSLRQRTSAARSDDNTSTRASEYHSNIEDNEDDEEGDEDEQTGGANDDEFHDAVEDVTQFSVTLPRTHGAAQVHHRHPSNISKLYLQESDLSSGDDEDQQTIKVTMHSNKDMTELPALSHQQSKATTANKLKNVQSAVVLSPQNKKGAPSSTDILALKAAARPQRNRRKSITPRPNYSLNLWSIMKNCIGKDLSKIPIPVNFSEPLSMLQRVTEELEYANLLDLAANCEDQWEQMAYVAAFTVTSYSTTATRTNKPFNPLLGETYECDRLDDLGWRSMSEQVSHHPPGFSMHVESIKDWKFYQEFTMSSKFRGQYLQIVPLGTSHLEFRKTGHHYTWRKVSTFVRNIIVGRLWIDNVGEMDIVNHKTKDVCHLKYFAYSYFSREPPRKVTGIITDSNNVARYVLNGTWTDQIEGAPVLNPQVVTEQTQLNTGVSKVLWRRRFPPPHLETMYNFTELAVQLNEPEPGVAPTDSRLRPDQRLMEDGNWDQANVEKLRIEEKQRTMRRARETSQLVSSRSEISMSTLDEKDELSSDNSAVGPVDGNPLWFKRSTDPYTNQPIHLFNNEYWECKEKKDWSRCPDIF